MKTVILLVFSFGAMAFGKTELNCTAKSNASLHENTTQVRTVATHKPAVNKSVKKGKQQR